MFVFELPTTGAVSFDDLCIDNANAYTARIADATSARANVRAILKESKRSDSEKDYLRLVKVLDDYLPHLYAIIKCLAADELLLRNDHPLFSWRSMLSSNTFNSSPRMNFPGLHSDLAFTLLTYAFALCNMSASIVSSLENYERERHISDTERRLKDERLNFAVTLLCRASGIFTHVADVVLLQLLQESDSALCLPRIPDLNKEVITALAKLCLADAQSLAIRKLLSKSAHDASLTPGPPLPKSHPSPALLAKLHLFVSTLYSSAHSLAKTPFSLARQQINTSAERRGMDADVNADITKYLAEEGAFATALAHKWLGVEAGEAGKCGEAVAYLSWAQEELDGVKEGKRKMPHLGGGGSNGKEGKEKKKVRKGRVVEETEHVALFLDTYKRENNSVHFQKVPSRAEILSLIPTGRAAIATKPYNAPAPAFGPGSIDRVANQTSGLYLERDENEVERGTTPRYAGAGSYF